MRRFTALLLIVASAAIAIALSASGGGPKPKLSGALEVIPKTTRSIGLSPVTVASEPSGPGKPSSGWMVPYADGFGEQISTSEDNTWFPNHGGGTESSCKTPTENCKGDNGNEMQAYNGSEQKVTSEGLRLDCKYTPGVSNFFSKTQNYTCGSVEGPLCCHVSQNVRSGYNSPVIRLGLGQTIVFEAKIKLPVNTGEGDPAFWMNGPEFTSKTEFDYPEFYGSNKPIYKPGSGWTKTPNFYHWFAGTEPTKWGLSNSPETTFHTYTTEVFPGSVSGKYRIKEWIDGVLQKMQDETEGCYSETCSKTESREVEPETAVNKLDLILQYGLREGEYVTAGKSNYFQTPGEERAMFFRSVAIYEDKEHENVGVTKPVAGAAAPGTLIAGSTEEVKEKEEESKGPVYKVKQELRASQGTWRNTPISYAYQWKRCDKAGSSCVSITGGTSQIYTVAFIDVGHTLRVTVKATNAQGTGQSTSAATGVVIE